MFRFPKCCLVLLVRRRRIGGWTLLIRLSISCGPWRIAHCPGAGNMEAYAAFAATGCGRVNRSSSSLEPSASNR